MNLGCFGSGLLTFFVKGIWHPVCGHCPLWRDWKVWLAPLHPTCWCTEVLWVSPGTSSSILDWHPTIWQTGTSLQFSWICSKMPLTQQQVHAAILTFASWENLVSHSHHRLESHDPSTLYPGASAAASVGSKKLVFVTHFRVFLRAASGKGTVSQFHLDRANLLAGATKESCTEALEKFPWSHDCLSANPHHMDAGGMLGLLFLCIIWYFNPRLSLHPLSVSLANHIPSVHLEHEHIFLAITTTYKEAVISFWKFLQCFLPLNWPLLFSLKGGKPLFWL